MRHYKLESSGYILAIGTGDGNEEITESEYENIMAVIHNKPARTDTTDYRLKADLTWEAYNVDPPDPDPDIDDTELVGILLGVEE